MNPVTDFPRIPVEAVDIGSAPPPLSMRSGSPRKRPLPVDEVIVLQSGGSFRQLKANEVREIETITSPEYMTPSFLLAGASDPGILSLNQTNKEDKRVIDRSVSAETSQSVLILVFLFFEGALTFLTCIWVYMAYGKSGSERAAEPAISSAYRLLIQLALVGALLKLSFSLGRSTDSVALAKKRQSIREKLMSMIRSVLMKFPCLLKLSSFSVFFYLCALIAAVVCEGVDDLNWFNLEISSLESWRQKILARSVLAWLGVILSAIEAYRLLIVRKARVVIN